MAGSSEAALGAPAAEDSLFRAVNRGIVLGAVYVLLLAVVRVKAVFPELRPDERIAYGLFGALGLVAGAIGGFSNTSAHEDARRDLARNALDTLMISVWAANLLLLANLALDLAPAPALLRWLACIAGGALLGGVVGEPVLTYLGRTTIKGRQPFMFVNRLTAGIQNPDHRLVVRILVQTLLAAALIVIAFVTVIVILALIALTLTLLIVSKLLGGEGGGQAYSRRQTGLLGDEYVEHFDEDGNKTGESHKKVGIFGGEYTEHQDADGKKTGESTVETGLFGGEYVEHRDADGKKTGESTVETGLLGGEYMEHRDADGEKVGESRLEEGLFEDRVVHTRTKRDES